MRSQRAAIPLLLIVLLGAGGCGPAPLGPRVDDAGLRRRLLAAVPAPPPEPLVFQTLVHWPGREVALTEVIRVDPNGTVSLVGLADLGATLYAVRVDRAGRVTVQTRHLPLSAARLREALVLDLVAALRGPSDRASLHADPAGGWILADPGAAATLRYRFDGRGRWVGLQRGAARTVSSGPAWQRLDTENPRQRLRIVRERRALTPGGGKSP